MRLLGRRWRCKKILGPGYLKVVYQAALAQEFDLRGIQAKREQHLPITYKGVDVGDYIADFVVENKIILELKATTNLIPKHKAQAINYLTATGIDLAILINFGEKSLKSQRVIRKKYK